MARGRGVMAAGRGKHRYQPYNTQPGYGYPGYGYGGYNSYPRGGGRGQGHRGGFLGKQMFSEMNRNCDNRLNHNDKKTVTNNEMNDAQVATNEINSLVSGFCTFRPEEGRLCQEGQERREVRPEAPIRNEEVGECSVFHSVNIKKYEKFKAGRISKNYDKWRRLTSDYRILQDIKGYKIEFQDWPTQSRPEREIRFSQTEREFVRQEIEKLLEKGVLVEVEHEENEYISNIFLREKKEQGKFRMILNLKKLNRDVEHEHFKMDTLQAALGLVTYNCWFISLDFSDAYYSLAVHPQHRKYLRFQFEGKLYEFTCVANGLRAGPRLFTKVLKVPLAYLREQKGISISGYLDDTVIISSSPQEVLKAGQDASDLFQDLGYMVSAEKSVLTPTQVIEYLGFKIDSRTMRVEMTDLKVNKLMKWLHEFQERKTCTIRWLAKVIGKLNATGPANPFAALFTKRMEMVKMEELKSNQFDYDALMVIPESCKQDAVWWITNLATISRPIIRGQPDYKIFTDASMEGWCCHDSDRKHTFGGKWSVMEKQEHINLLELKAILFGLKATCREMTNGHVRIMSDNTTAVCCVQKQGSSHSWKFNEISREIWSFAIERGLWLSCAHCPGKLNYEADHGSRVFRDETEWTISEEIFREICQIYGEPDIDLFATQLNCRMKPFCAWHPDPEASCIDAFMQDWSEFRNVYMFPPFAILSAVLQKFVADGAEGIILAPFWPTKPWFTMLAGLLIEEPYIIRTDGNVLSLCSSMRKHPLSGKLRIMACKCSSDRYKQQEFQKQYVTPSCVPDGNHRGSYIRSTGPVGTHIVGNGIWIPLRHRQMRH